MNVLLLSGAPRVASAAVLEAVREIAELGSQVRLASWATPSVELLAAVEDAVVLGPAKRPARTAPVRIPAESGQVDPVAADAPETEVAAPQQAEAGRAGGDPASGTDAGEPTEQAVPTAGPAGPPAVAPAVVPAATAPPRPTGLGPARVRAAARWRYRRLRRWLRPRRARARQRVLRYRAAVRRRLEAQASRLWWRLSRDPRVLAAAGQADVIVALDLQSVRAAWHLAQRYREPDVVFGLSAGLALVKRRVAEAAGAGTGSSAG